MPKGMGRPVALRNKNMFKDPIRFKRSIQNTDLYRNQRSYALMRAKNRCENCKAAIGELSPKGNLITQFDMHHIEEFDTLIEKYKITTIPQARLCPALWDLKNVQILCHDCHAQTSSYGCGKS
jgi:hypothetical protein